MLLNRFRELESQVNARGWRYDVRDEVFRDEDGRIVKVTMLLRLLPDLTINELVSYQDDRFGRSRKVPA